ncbi:MAG: hypothetical protein O3C40_29225 [Planctomycetota bacterium]|nr:hypothetical protein [Planctomycetota bacterium]
MTTTPRTPGVIRADEAYTVAEFRRRAALGDYAFREVRRAGLRIISIGKKRFILGRDWLEFLNTQQGDV